MKRLIVVLAVALIGGIILFTGCQNTAVSSAKVYIQQNNLDAAIEQAQTAIEQEPDNAEAYFVLGNAYGMKQMFREMNEAYTKSIELSDKHVEEIDHARLKYWIDIFNTAVAQIKQDQLDEAAENFQLCTEIMPEKIDAYKNLAFVYSQSDNTEGAIEAYKRGLEVDPTDIEMKNFLGVLYYQGKQYEEAIEILGQVLEEAEPTSEEYKQALFNTAFSYDLMGKPELAIEAYMNAIEAVPGDKDLLFNLARLHYMQDNYEEAIMWFTKVLELDPADFEANFNIGVSYLQMEKFEDAIPTLEKATQVSPENANAWTNLGIAYVRAGDAEKGQEAFDKADALKGTE